MVVGNGMYSLTACFCMILSNRRIFQFQLDWEMQWLISVTIGILNQSNVNKRSPRIFYMVLDINRQGIFAWELPESSRRNELSKTPAETICSPYLRGMPTPGCTKIWFSVVPYTASDLVRGNFSFQLLLNQQYSTRCQASIVGYIMPLEVLILKYYMHELTFFFPFSYVINLSKSGLRHSMFVHQEILHLTFCLYVVKFIFHPCHGFWSYRSISGGFMGKKGRPAELRLVCCA